MSTINYLKGIWQGKKVFVELTNAQLYGDGQEIVTVFEEKNGQIFLHSAKIAELQELGPEN